MHIAFLGPAGTFTQAAALEALGHSVVSVPMSAIDEVFRRLSPGGPLWGSAGGKLHGRHDQSHLRHVYDLFGADLW